VILHVQADAATTIIIGVLGPLIGGLIGKLIGTWIDDSFPELGKKPGPIAISVGIVISLLLPIIGAIIAFLLLLGWGQVVH